MTTTTYKTCVSVAKYTSAEMRHTLTNALSRSPYAEARLDYITLNDAKKNVTKLLDALPKEQLRRRIICTIRSKQDGGKFKGSEHQRRELLRMVAAYKPYRLDVEIDALQNNTTLANDLMASGVNILASWHNFDYTPSAGEMRRKLKSMLKYTTHLKIACMAQNLTESMRMLDMYRWLANENQKKRQISTMAKKRTKNNTRKITLVSFAMGSAGQLTRILCMHLGSPYMYVSLGKAIAPGQLSLADVNNIELALRAIRRG